MLIDSIIQLRSPPPTILSHIWEKAGLNWKSDNPRWVDDWDSTELRSLLWELCTRTLRRSPVWSTQEQMESWKLPEGSCFYCCPVTWASLIPPLDKLFVASGFSCHQTLSPHILMWFPDQPGMHIETLSLKKRIQQSRLPFSLSHSVFWFFGLFLRWNLAFYLVQASFVLRSFLPLPPKYWNPSCF
jgi:hypothetical protein